MDNPSQWGNVVIIEDGTVQLRMSFDIVYTFETIQEFDRFTSWLVESSMVFKFKSDRLKHNINFDEWLERYVDNTIREATENVSEESKNGQQSSDPKEVSNPNQGSGTESG